jgi:transaldolase
MTSTTRGRRAVFVDRDGVINRAVVRGGRPYPPARVEDVEILPGVVEAVEALRAVGFLVIVATNQPDVAAGRQTRAGVDAIHRLIRSAVPVDDVRTCPHVDADRCACRKPKPGLLVEAAGGWGIDLSRSFMVGDRWRDVGAGRAAGCRTVLVGDGYGETFPDMPHAVAGSLAEAAALILAWPGAGADADRPPGGPNVTAPSLADLKVKIFADGADLATIARLARDPTIRGFTTNPTLMRKANVHDYREFALNVLAVVPDRPVSFEVFSDDFDEMERQAREIASWGKNVYVKVPVTDTTGAFAGPLVSRLTAAGVKVNVTALTTMDQVERVAEALADGVSSFVSVFAGRVADTGRDPVPIMRRAVEVLRARPGAELIWASPRELLNVVQADEVGCHVITATPEILARLPLIGKDLAAYSLETVRMFRRDAVDAGYDIDLHHAAAGTGA